ncbi:MAG TPA: hypothetical protein VHS97_12665 [Isosphaeraceae bacterium]|nr:hypothetical protein [Isosphaeraceae bacterium]
MSARKLASAKRVQEKKQKRLQKLRRKQGGSSFGSSRLSDGPLGLESMSDVLKAFVEPWMEMAETDEARHKLLTLAVAAWNAALLPDHKRKPFIDDLASAGGIALADRASFYSIIQEMIDRKQAYFARITRSIFSFDVQKTGDRKYFIHVVSTLPLPPAGKD